jgi:hypothetical protein
MRNQSREWTVERLGWLVFAATLLAALLGILGPGPLSNSRQQTQDGRLVVEYYSVERYEAPAELRIRFQPVHTEDGLIRLAVSREFTDATTPEAITPAPDSVEMRDDRIVYAFRAADLGKEGSIIYRYKNNSFGRLRYDIGLAGEASVSIAQFICP